MKIDKTEIINSVKHFFRKNGPTIMVGVGIAGSVWGCVTACKATLKLEEVLTKEKEELDKIHTYKKEKGFSDKYTENDYNHDILMTYTKMAIKTAKLYAPAVGIYACSMALIGGSHKIMTDRNTQLMTGYSALVQMYEQYRTRVKERFGEEVEKQIAYNCEEVKTVSEFTDENGKVHKKTEKNMVAKDPIGLDPFTRAYDSQHNANFFNDPNPEERKYHNKNFLDQSEMALQWKLEAKGYLRWSEVLQYLGYHAAAYGEGEEYYLYLGDSEETQDYGWLYSETEDPDRPKRSDLNKIRLNPDYSDPDRIYLHPNVEGFIRDKIREYAR